VLKIAASWLQDLNFDALREAYNKVVHSKRNQYRILKGCVGVFCGLLLGKYKYNSTEKRQSTRFIKDFACLHPIPKSCITSIGVQHMPINKIWIFMK